MPVTEKYKSFDDIKCLWMKCGAVEYKLCDKDFECENCEFDKQMMLGQKTKGQVEEKINEAFEIGQRIISFSHPYYHFSSGLIVRNFFADNYYLGLEPFITQFIDKHSLLKFTNANNIVNKGDPVLSVSNGWGGINVLSPFNFSFVEKLDINGIFSNDLQWIAIIKAERYEIISNSLNKKSYFNKLHKTRQYLREQLKNTETVGKTMYDGGEITEMWSEILGKNIYKDFMAKLFT